MNSNTYNQGVYINNSHFSSLFDMSRSSLFRIRILNTIFDKFVKFNNSIVRKEINLESCLFFGDFFINDTEVQSDLFVSGNYFNCDAVFENMKFNGNFEWIDNKVFRILSFKKSVFSRV